MSRTKLCPLCLNPVKRVAHFNRGEITLIVNGKIKVKPPMEIITFYPCGHTVEKRIPNEQ